MERRARGRASSVEDLPVFGTAFDHMPRRGQLLLARSMLSGLVARCGVLGALGVLGRALARRSRLERSLGDSLRAEFPNVPRSALGELLLFAALYEVLTDAHDRETAYEIILDLFRPIGPGVHAALYDIDRLLEIGGDPYANFCALNRSFFESSAAKGLYEIEEIRETRDLQYVKLTTCLNVDVFSAIGYPELARIACVMDIAGYGPEGLAPRVGLDFRRPKTIMRGDDACEFYYYRAGAAPAEMETH